MIRPVIPLVTAALLFGLGSYGVLRRRNAVLVLMAVELMLNAVNLVLVTADGLRDQITGQVFTLFVIVLAAAEVGVGLALVLRLSRLRGTIDTDDIPLDHLPAADATLLSGPTVSGARAVEPARIGEPS
jgi:NADH-quinone oxidoreductase subunit K